MSEDRNAPRTHRRRFLAGVGVAATAGALAAGSHVAKAQGLDGEGFRPPRHDKDAWMGSLAGDKDHRVFIDSASGVGGATAVLYANNILSAHKEDYAGADDEYAMIVCFRHAATALGYTDVMWQKYGEVFSRVTRLSVPGGDSPLKVNPLTLEGANFGNIGNTLDHVRGRGVHFAICNRATHSMSRRLSAATGQSAASHYAELIRENIATSRFVPAGVMAATRSQEYGYSLLYAG